MLRTLAVRCRGSRRTDLTIDPLGNPPYARQRRRALDIHGRLVHLDQAIQAATDQISSTTRAINLELQPSKIQIWTT